MYFRLYVISILLVMCACAEAHLSHKEVNSAREQFKYPVHPLYSARSGRLRVIILEFMTHPSSINLTSFFLKLLQLRLLPKNIIARLFLETKSKVFKKTVFKWLIFPVKEVLVF